MNSFRGQTVLITGGSSGIGKALGFQFAREGANVVLFGRRSSRLESLVDELRRRGLPALGVTGDVSIKENLENAVSASVNKFGAVNIVIANAGFGVAGAVEYLTVDDFRRQFEINVFGVLHTFYACLEELKRNKGTFVILGSVAAELTLPENGAYSMSKAAVHVLARALSDEVRKYGIKILLVIPGFVESEIRRVDNLGVLHEKAKDPVPSWLVMPSETAAKKIVSAVKKGKSEVTITLHGKIARVIVKYAPWIIILIKFFGIKGRHEPTKLR